MSSVKSPGWKRAAQIGLGIIAIIVSGAALFFPGLTVVSLIILLAVVLIFIGIEKIISGIFIQHKSRTRGPGDNPGFNCSGFPCWHDNLSDIPYCICINVRRFRTYNSWVYGQAIKRMVKRI